MFEGYGMQLACVYLLANFKWLEGGILHTVKVGRSTMELVTDSTASVADETISPALEDTEETTSSASACTCPSSRAVP